VSFKSSKQYVPSISSTVKNFYSSEDVLLIFKRDNTTVYTYILEKLEDSK
jgi:hypothetical protein